MYPNLPRGLQEFVYEREAQAYLRSLPPEHFMETTRQAAQRAITLASFALVKVRRPEVQVFNELLVQYPRRGHRKLGQVVPDNMVVCTTEPVRAVNSYNVPLEPARPFWMLEYVSKGSERKDYEDSSHKYERELKVPYYLVFYTDTQDLTLSRHNKRKYVTVKPNGPGRYPIPQLDLEVGLLDGWVRFWYEGELLPQPAELQHQLDMARRLLADQKHRADGKKHRADEGKRHADEEKRRADELQRRLEAAERELSALRDREGNR
jgi:Uma2 family endonuclease